VEAIEPIFMNRWNLTTGATLQSLNKAYIAAQEHPSDSALALLKDTYLRSFADLAADEKQKLQSAKTTAAVATLFYSTLNGGQRIRFRTKTLFKHEEDDDDDVPNKTQVKPTQANQGQAKPANKKDDDGDESGGYFEVSTPFGDCGVQFQAGETYLVYANNDENSGLLSTTTCTRTRRLSDAGDDLPYLFFYKNQPHRSTRLEGFVTTDERYQLDLNRMHDPEAVKSPVPGVIVELRLDDLVLHAETDVKGRFVFDGLDDGNYTLAAYANGYPSKTQLLAGPRPMRLEDKGCALQILLLPKTDTSK
jgi:hypothetical protein